MQHQLEHHPHEIAVLSRLWARQARSEAELKEDDDDDAAVAAPAPAPKVSYGL